MSGQHDDRWRWVVLAVGTASQTATSAFTYGMPLLVPSLRADEHISLVRATVVVSAPMAGLLLTLVLWGAAADRWGERMVMVTGTAGAGVALLAASAVHGPLPTAVALAFAGASGASVNAASGRVVMGWFARRQRGLAMGVRQTAQPLGVALAGFGLPPLARHHGPHHALLLPAGLCLAVSVALLVLLRDPVREPTPAGTVAASPYKGSDTLWRIHASSSLLVVPQFAVSTFTVVYLTSQRHWDPVAAGRLSAAFQFVGAAGRISSGVWSDRVNSRLRPMRQLGWASAVLMGLLAAGAWAHAWWIIPVLGVAAVVTVADNGLAYTSVAEVAGTSWSGRALGLHNTTQNVASVLTGPLMALVVGESRYGLAFALVVAAPVLAVPIIPVRGERS